MRLRDGHYFGRDALRGVGVEMVVEVEDVKAMHAQVQASGYEIYEELQEQSWGSIDFRLVDPDGYNVRITSK